jgi:hypothetical protein
LEDCRQYEQFARNANMKRRQKSSGGFDQYTTALTLRALRRAEHSGYRDYLDAELELAALNLHNPDIVAARMSFKKSHDVANASSGSGKP